MSLRQTLLASFVGLIVLTLLVFGYSAYQIAQRSSTDTETELLAQLNHERSLELATEYRKHPALSYLREHIGVDREDIRVLTLLVDQSHRILGASSDARLAALATDRLPMPEGTGAGPQTGEINLNGQAYTLAATSITGSPYTLVFLSPRGFAAHGALSQLASRLGVTGLIIAWIAVWIGLVISTAVARRLKAHTDKLRHQATHDALTDLPNRLSLLENLNAAIETSRESGRTVALILMDLDRFKDINDTLGHDTGDILIKQLADRLRIRLWDGDTVARLGGDEFGLVLPMASSADTRLVVNKLRSILAEPFKVHNLSLTTDASIGVALFPAHAGDAVSLMRCVETAMYRAKSTRRGYEIYDPANDPYSVERLKLTADVGHALVRGELFLVYQPKIDVATGNCTGAEALLRWKHPEHGFVPPDKFIPLAEQTSAIKDITHWTVNVAIAQCRAWHDAGFPLSVAVNLSATMLHDTSLADRIGSLLHNHGVAPECLQLEITETAIMLDRESAFETLKALSDLGVRLSIDDFGTGYSSLAYLRKLPVSEIKIDKSFVMHMLDNENDATIVYALIDLAHRINLRVVAEGVESEAILAALASKHCDESQGYYFSRPLPAEDFAKWYLRAAPRRLASA